MKVFALVVSTLLLLATPSLAVVYQGKNIDGKKLPAKAYYSETGGVYNVQVLFKGNRATIYFDGGSQTTIRLNKQVITDPKNIEGFGKLGQISLNRHLSIGLHQDDGLAGNGQPSGSLSLGNYLWRISLK